MSESFVSASTTSTASFSQLTDADKAVAKRQSSVLIIDSTVEDLAILLGGLVPGTHVVRAEAGKLTEVAQELKTLAPVGAVHILTHGEPGAFTLGGERVDTASLDSRTPIADALTSIAASASSIALWACDVAKGMAGARFIEKLSDLTGATVAAAAQPVGAEEKGGTWDIGAPSPFTAEATLAYPHALSGTFDFTGGSISDGGSGTSFTETVNDGVDVEMTVSLSNSGTLNITDLSSSFENTTTEFLWSNSELSDSVTLTVSFDTAVTISSFLYLEADTQINEATSYIFTPVGGSGASTITLGTGDFTNSNVTVSPADWVGVTGFTVTVNSGGTFQPGLDTINFTVVSNSAPDLGGTPADDSATEDVATAIDLSAYNISDTDGDTITLTLEVDRGTIASTDGNGTTSGVTVATSGTTSMTLQGSVSDLNTYLNDTSKITFTTDSNDTTSATLTVTPNDGTEDGTADTVTITISAVNDDPTISGLVTDITATEDASSDVDLSAADFSDVDSTGDVTVKLVVNDGVLVAGSGGAVTVSGSGSDTLSLSGTFDEIESYLDTTSNIDYVGSENTNGNDAATLTVVANDGDGSGDVTLGTVNIDITAVNDDPTATGIATDYTVTEDTASNVDLSNVDFTDVDSSGTVFVILTASEGTLAASSGGGVTVSGSGSAALTLTGTFANIETFLDTTNAVQYTSASDDSGDNAATLTITANDDDGSGDVSLATANFDITDVNDDPGISGLVSDLTFSEDTAGNVDLSAADFTDVDSAGDVTVVLVASSGTFTSSNGTDVTVGGSGSDTLTLSGTFDEIETFLDTASNIQYTGASNTSGNDVAAITVVANDGEGSGNVTLGTVNVDITAVNDDPTASGGPTDLAFEEDTAGNVDLSSLDFNDVDSTGTVFVTLTASEGTLTGSSAGGVTVSGSGTAALTLTGNFDAIETFLDTTNAVRYTGASNDFGDDTATITVSANDDDGSGDVDLLTANVDITGFNDEPSVTATGDDPTFTEDGANGDLFSSVTVDTVEDGQSITGMTLTVTNISDSGAEFLNIDGTAVDLTTTDAGTTAGNGLDWSVSFAAGTATITLVGVTLTEAETQTLIDGLSYHNSSDTPSTGSSRVVTITEMTDDGGSFGANDDTATLTISSTVTVAANNDDPTATGGPTDITVLEETASNVDLSSADFSDADSNGDATVTLVADTGTLSATSSADVTVTGSGSDTLTLSGTFDEIETFLDTTNAVQYTGASNVSGDDAATLTVQANDGDGSGDVTVFTSNFDITDINDEPTLTATGQDPTFTEGGANSDLFSSVTADTIESGQTITNLSMTVTNVSDGSDEVLVIDGTSIALTNSNSGTTATNSLSYSVSVSSGTATLSFSGGTMSEAETQTLIDGMVYTNSSDDPTTGSNRVVTITSLTDSGSNTGSNDDTAALSITSTVSITAVNDAPVVGNLNGDNSSSVVAGDGAQDVTDLNDVTVTNADSSDYSGGFLTLSQLSGTTNGDWSVDGTTVTSGGDGTITAGETIQVSGVTIGTVDATDDGQGGNDLTINFTTSDATDANIQTFIQNLLLSPPTGIGDRAFTLTLNDGDGTTNGGDEDTSATFTVTVSSQPPEATGVPADITVTEDVASNVDLSGVTFSDGDDTDLIVTLSVDAGTLAATTGGGVTVTGSGTATVELSGNIDDINTYLDDTDAVQYTSDANDEGDNAATLTITANDDNGSGDVNVGSSNIDITGVDDAPSFGGALTATMGEDDDTVAGTATVTDVDAGEGNYDAATPGGLYGDLQIEANGDWVYDLDEANSDVQALNAGDTLQDTITVQSDDGSNQDIVITIEGCNDAATFGGDLTATLNEDTSSVDGTATVSDVDNDNDFTAATPAGSYGTLTIAANGDWTYDLDEANGDVQALAEGDTLQDTISVAAVDGTSQDIIITIDGVNDDATFGGNLTGAINEDGTTTTGTATVTDVDTGEGTFNADTIAGANGELEIAANGDWTYTIDNSDSAVQALAAGDTLDDTITVESDDGTEQDIVITITGINDLPTSSGGSFSTSEDRTKAFGESNFNFNDVDTGDTLASVRIDTLPTTGTLKLSGVAVTAGDVIAVGDIGNLTFTPPANYAGNTSFTYTVNDGTGFASSTATMSVRTTAVNDAPSDIDLDGSTVRENAVGAVIGTVDVTDVDSDEHTLTVSDSRFTINSNGELKLKAGQSIDYETESSVTLTITANDDGGASLSQDFTITVTDVSEFTGGDDDDTVDGGDDDDLVLSLGGDDRVRSGNGRDTVDGGDGNDDIDGGDDDDLLSGGTGNDTLNGGTGEDTLRGGLGNDNVISGLGNDLVFSGLGDLGNDVVQGGGGLDSLGGGFGNDLLQGEDNDDLLWGRFGNDTVDGGSGNDMLYNGEGTDTVIGGSGNDTLWAGNDDDFLSGGDGEDVFMFGAVSGNDTIRDFDIDDDQINLRYSGAGFSSVADVQAAATLTTKGGESGVLISWDDGNQSAFIVGLTLDQLSSVDFVL